MRDAFLPSNELRIRHTHALPLLALVVHISILKTSLASRLVRAHAARLELELPMLSSYILGEPLTLTLLHTDKRCQLKRQPFCRSDLDGDPHFDITHTGRSLISLHPVFSYWKKPCVKLV
jgi:hypothetical protein